MPASRADLAASTRGSRGRGGGRAQRRARGPRLDGHRPPAPEFTLASTLTLQRLDPRLDAYRKPTPRGPRRNLRAVPVSQSQPIARTSTGSWPTLCARAAPHSRAGVDKVQHTPRPDRCFLLQRPRFTPRVPRAQGTRHARASSAVSACSAPRRMAATHHAHITSGAARRAATRLAAGPRGRAGARLAGVQEEGNAVPLRHCAHGRHIIYAPAAARRAVRMRWRPAPLTALLAGCCAHAKSAQGRPC